MEETQHDRSPLSAYPSEHPLPSQQPKSHSTRIIIGVVGIGLVTLLTYGGYMFLSQKNLGKSESKTVSAPTSVPSPKVVIANAATYKNPTYNYAITYDQTLPQKTADTPKYGYSDFANGCMKVYTVPLENEKTMPLEKNGIPWDQITDLETMPVGQTRNCSVLTFTFAADGHAIVNKNDYKRTEDETFANATWHAFAVRNGAGVTTHNVYFTKRETNRYVIETQTGGSCPDNLAEDMKKTFSFTP